jgi:hypothetical protein
MNQILQLHFRGRTVPQIGCDLHLRRTNVYNTLYRRGLRPNSYYHTPIKYGVDHVFHNESYLIDPDVSSLPNDLGDYADRPEWHDGR